MNKASTDAPTPEDPKGRSDFPTTRWSILMRVREGGAHRQAALEELCGLYWYPIYVYLRGRGFSQHDAEDMAQSFFAKVLTDSSFETAKSEKGRLRNFLLGALNNHIVDCRRRDNAQKRGGQMTMIAFDDMKAEERYALEPRDYRDPEKLFFRAWARLLIDDVREKLRETFIETREAGVFELLLPYLLGDEPTMSYREVATKLGASETAVRLLVFRQRSKFRELLREEVGRTVNAPEDVGPEMEWLKSMLGAN